jgi:hypothetical protein
VKIVGENCFKERKMETEGKTIDFIELETLAGKIKGKVDNLSEVSPAFLEAALLDVWGLCSTLSGLIFKDALIVR